MVSISSFIVLLLVAYCSSVPIVKDFDFTTSKYDWTTEKTLVERNGIDVESVTDDKPIDVKVGRRRETESDSEEHTTSFVLEKDGDHHKRTNEDLFFTTSFPEHFSKESLKTRGIDEDLFTTLASEYVTVEPHKLRSFDDDLYTTVESKTSFNDRAISLREEKPEEEDKKRNIKSEEEEKRSTESEEEVKRGTEPEEKKRNIKSEEEEKRSTESEEEVKRSTEPEEKKRNIKSEEEVKRGTESEEEKKRSTESEDELKIKKHIESSEFDATVKPVERNLDSFETTLSPLEPKTNTFESSSSVDSFGKYTGLLHDEKVVEKLTTPEYETVPVTEESKIRFPDTKEKLVQTETIIPGEITETKVFVGVPSQTFVINERISVQQPQLTEGQTRVYLETKKSDN